MGGIIHISTRRNLFYLSQLILHYYLRKIDLIIINTKYKFSDSLLFTILMLSGEFFAGLSIYIYQKLIFKKDENKNIKYFGIELRQEEHKIKSRDSKFKIYLLIFFVAYFDFIEFTIVTYYIPKYKVISPTADTRFGGFIIILSSLLCYYNLRLKIMRHQFYCLLIIGISSVILIIFEFIFKVKGITLVDFCLAYFLFLLYIIFVTFTDVVEKYLLEYDYLNPFIVLILESTFGFIFLFIYSFGEDPLKDIRRIYFEYSKGDFILLIFLLFLYMAFSAGVNVYKLISNVFYSPMAKTLATYILNPFLYIYYFYIGIDFLENEEKNWIYFIINIIFAIVLSFFGCVYNEFLILSCCKLDYETHWSISIRAGSKEDDSVLNKAINDFDNNDSDDLTSFGSEI